MTRRVLTVLALGCALSIGAPALAMAADGGTAAQAVTDCNDHGRLTQSYSSPVLRQALAQMPADVREYTDCFDVIERQLFKQLGQSGAAGGGTSASSGSSGLPTWLIVVIVVLALAAITFGALALRRRRTPPGPGTPDGPDGPAGPPPDGPGPPASEPSDSEGPPASGP